MPLNVTTCFRTLKSNVSKISAKHKIECSIKICITKKNIQGAFRSFNNLMGTLAKHS